MKKTKTEKGITLIALIITIVLLLILAVVTINAIQGDGIIQYASNASDDYQSKANEEQGIINGYLSQIQEGLSGEKKITWKKTSNGDLAVGSTVVTSTGENFYVIGFKDNNETVVLLAKDCIDTTNLVQSISAEPVAFCEKSVEGYWGSGTAPYDIKEEVQPIPSTHTAAYAADRYGAKLGVIGRLMTYSEAEDLWTVEYEDILYGTNGKSSSSYLCYWLGSAVDSKTVYHAWDGYGVLVAGGIDHYDEVKVRPVVEISISKIS